MKVVQKDGVEEVFDWRRVYTSLKEETGCENEVAEEATRYITNHLLSYKLPHVTGPLIRELACIALMELGRDDLRRKYTRVGMPVFDATNLDAGGGKGDNANLQCSPETVHKRKADRVSKEQYYLSLPEHLAQAHLSGDIHIHDLEYFGTRQFCLDSDLRYFFKYGFVGDGTGEHTSIAGPAKRAEVAILHAAKVLGASQTQCAGGQGFYNFLTFLAPFFENRDYRDYYQCMQMFCYEMTQMLVARGGQAVFSSVQLSPGVPKLWQNIPIVYKGKVWDGKEAPLRTYGEFEAENRLLFKAMMEVMLEGDHTGKPFYFPKPEINIAPEFVELLDQEILGDIPSYRELYMLSFELASKFGTPYFDNTMPKYRQTGGVECFQCQKEGELIIVRRSGKIVFIQIETLLPDDEILTPLGFSYHRGLLSKQYSGNMVTIRLIGGRSVTVTPEHKILTSNGLIEASRLKVGDSVKCSANLPECGTRLKEILDVLEIPEDKSLQFVYWCGVYLAEGTIIHRPQYQGGWVQFSFSAKEHNLSNKIVGYTHELFKLDPKVKEYASERRVLIYSKKLCELLIDIVGLPEKSSTGHIPEFVYSLPKELKFAFVQGYFRGDGTLIRVNNRPGGEKKFFKLNIQTKSKEIAHGIQLICGSLGVNVRIAYISTRDMYNIVITSKEDIINFFNCSPRESGIELQIKDIFEEYYDGNVYDPIEVNGNIYTSYDGVSISNCCAYSFKANEGTDCDFDDKLHFRNGAHFSMGAWQVMTLNLPRIAANGDADTVDGRMSAFLYKSKKVLDLCVDVFKEKRSLMDANVKRGSVPFLSQQRQDEKGNVTPPLVDFDKLVWTVGICGLNEVVKHITGSWLHEDKQAQRIGLRICLELKKYCEHLSKEHNMPIVLSRTPAETTAQRFATMDLLNWIDEGNDPAEFVCQGDLTRVIEEHLYKKTRDLPIYYTNGTHISPAAQIPITDRVRIEQAFFPVLDGGNICHIWMGEAHPSPGGLMDLTLKACQNTNLGYFAFTRDMTTRTTIWRRYSP